MAKKNFSAGSTKSGVLNNDGGENSEKSKLRHNTILNIFQKIRLFLILRMNSIHKTE